MKKIFVRHEFNYDMNEASDASGLKCEDESLTKQAFAEESDINFIVKRFGLTGQLPVGQKVPLHQDMLDAVDFHEAMSIVAQARMAFMALPAEVRSRFGNDAANLVDFVSKAENYDEALKLGLVVKRPEQPPVVAAAQAAPGAKTD